MAILAKGEFDINALRKERARKASNKSGMSKVDGLRQISPDIEKLNIGQTAQIPLPSKDKLRSVVMGISSKLSFLTCKGGEWEGKDFSVVSDGEEYVYVQRGPNLKGDDIKVRQPGGRKAGVPNKPKAEETSETETPEEAAEDVENGETVTVSDGVIIKEHA